MLTVTERNKAFAIAKAHNILEGLSDRQAVEKTDSMESSTIGHYRLVGIAMRSVLLGDDEKAFKKACKLHTKNTAEYIRYA